MLEELEIHKAYMKSPYLSYKHSSYFQVYEDLLNPYRKTNLTFVEVGVLNGGSLFMWREFFGPSARIIGIDLNPLAKRWEKDGFEIFIGSQSDSVFWEKFFSTVGSVDVILDDGGHTNEQQIITLNCCVPNIRDGGLLIIEDVHASYLKDFGNPSSYSFINYAKKLIDFNNFRFPQLPSPKNTLNQYIYSIEFYESIVACRINQKKCIVSEWTSNNGRSLEAEDFRYADSKLQTFANFASTELKKFGIKFSMNTIIKKYENFASKLRVKKYFDQ